MTTRTVDGVRMTTLGPIAPKPAFFTDRAISRARQFAAEAILSCGVAAFAYGFAYLALIAS